MKKIKDFKISSLPDGDIEIKTTRVINIDELKKMREQTKQRIDGFKRQIGYLTKELENLEKELEEYDTIIKEVSKKINPLG